MSHFTVMVIGDDVEKQLAPYHKYECTGNDDEYVVDVDCTAEVEEWLTRIIWVGTSKETGEPDYEYRESSAVERLNDWSEMSRKEWFESTDGDLDREIDEWFGYILDDGKYFNHTNPNSKWDWYQVGGRWSGFFKVKDTGEGELGDRSLMLMGEEPISAEYADVTTKGNVDIVAMMDGIKKDKEIQFDHLVAAIGDIEPISWTALRESYEETGKSIDDARDFYKNTNFRKAIAVYEKEHDVEIGGWFGDIYDDYYLHLPLNQARVRYVETAAMNCITPHAFVKDGQWVERGEMGWWGMASNEKDKDKWLEQFYKMFSELPDDTLITIVDCHI